MSQHSYERHVTCPVCGDLDGCHLWKAAEKAKQLPQNPKVTLLSYTPDPLALVWALWDASKTRNPTASIEWVKLNVPQKELEQLFWDVLAQDIPVMRNIDFVFMIENVSVSWREQAVRHKVGVIAGDNFGVDTVPELDASHWWSQSMRIESMEDFADRRAFRLPETIREKGQEVIDYYINKMEEIQEGYRTLLQLGIPMEDARELIPLGTHHRISWKLNLQALRHVLGKRGCWILQLGIWGPIITGMIEEMATRVSPVFRRLIAPPCIQDNKFTSCTYREENKRRVDGRDPQPTCPLYLCRDQHGVSSVQMKADGVSNLTLPLHRKTALKAGQCSIPNLEWITKRAEEYSKFWDADPYTWDVFASTI